MKIYGFLVTCVMLVCAQQGWAEKLERLQTEVKGLLVIELPDGSHAGTASQMNATVVPGEDAETFHLNFNQDVGEMMESATREVEKLMRVRHADHLPKGQSIEFGFADKHSPKDGPSAAVACALMVESILTDVSLDPAFAVTGDITATGQVMPVGGVDAKIRGGTRKDCEIFAIPIGNRTAIDDFYLIDGLGAVTETQIILVETLDDALAVGRADKREKVAQALEDFKMVSKAIKNSPRHASHPKVVEKLKSILEAIPNHHSARLVALHGVGRAPKKLSLVGSLNEIEKRAARLAGSMDDGSFLTSGVDDAIWENISEFRDIRLLVDKRTTPFLDTFIETGRFIRENRGKSQYTPEMRRELNMIVGNIDIERNKLRNDREIQEELMDE